MAIERINGFLNTPLRDSNAPRAVKVFGCLSLLILPLVGWQIAQAFHYDGVLGALLGLMIPALIAQCVGVIVGSIRLSDAVRMSGIGFLAVLDVLLPRHSVWRSITSWVVWATVAASVADWMLRRWQKRAARS